MAEGNTRVVKIFTKSGDESGSSLGLEIFTGELSQDPDGIVALCQKAQAFTEYMFHTRPKFGSAPLDEMSVDFLSILSRSSGRFTVDPAPQKGPEFVTGDKVAGDTTPVPVAPETKPEAPLMGSGNGPEGTCPKCGGTVQGRVPKYQGGGSVIDGYYYRCPTCRTYVTPTFPGQNRKE